MQNLFSKSLIQRLRKAYIENYCDLPMSELDRRFACVGHNRYMINVDLEPPFLSPSLYANPILDSLLNEWLGSEYVISSFGSVVAFAGSADQSIHVDYPPLFDSAEVCNALPPYAISVVLPLIDLDDKTGATAVWPQSHTDPSSRDKLAGLVNGTDQSKPQIPYGKQGDALLMDMRLIHTGTANASDDARPLVYIVYARPWFNEQANFGEQPAIRISHRYLQKVPTRYRKLFSAAKPE